MVREIIVKVLYGPHESSILCPSPSKTARRPVTRWFLLSLTRAVPTCFYSPAYDGLVLRRNIVTLVSRTRHYQSHDFRGHLKADDDGTNRRENTRTVHCERILIPLLVKDTSESTARQMANYSAATRLNDQFLTHCVHPSYESNG